MKKLDDMTISELTELYNEQPGVSKISKFRDKATGIERLRKIMPTETKTINKPISQHTSVSTTVEVKVAKDTKLILNPFKDLFPCRIGTKVANAIDMLYRGATESEILLLLGETKKTKATRAKFNHWIRWNINNDKGYGVALKEEKYFLVMPKEGQLPLAHLPKKIQKPKKVKENADNSEQVA